MINRRKLVIAGALADGGGFLDLSGYPGYKIDFHPARQGHADLDKITTLVDQSGNSVDFTAPSAATEASYDAGEKAAFFGTGQYYGTSAGTEPILAPLHGLVATHYYKIKSNFSSGQYLFHSATISAGNIGVMMQTLEKTTTMRSRVFVMDGRAGGSSYAAYELGTASVDTSLTDDVHVLSMGWDWSENKVRIMLDDVVLDEGAMDHIPSVLDANASFIARFSSAGGNSFEGWLYRYAAFTAFEADSSVQGARALEILNGE